MVMRIRRTQVKPYSQMSIEQLYKLRTKFLEYKATNYFVITEHTKNCIDKWVSDIDKELDKKYQVKKLKEQERKNKNDNK